jgi:hypothetical protein
MRTRFILSRNPTLHQLAFSPLDLIFAIVNPFIPSISSGHAFIIHPFDNLRASIYNPPHD